MFLPVRRVLVILFLAASLTAQADWLVFIPSGRKLEFQTGRVEFLWAATTAREFRTTMGYGLTKSIEVDLTSETIDPRDTLLSLDASYTFTDPVVNYVPGLQIGVIDALNKTQDRRRFYIAASYDVGLTGLYNGDSPMQVTVGAVGGSLTGPFVGVAIPFTHSFIGLAEHDSHRMTAGFEFKPTHDTSVRWLFNGNRVLWSAGFSLRF